MGAEDPRAVAARKSRERERRKWTALTWADLLREEKRARRLAAETARANYWREKARALKRKLRLLGQARPGEVAYYAPAGGSAPGNPATEDTHVTMRRVYGWEPPPIEEKRP